MVSRLKQCTSGSGFRACHWKTRGGWSRRERRSSSTEEKAQQQHRQVEVLQLWSHKAGGRLLGSLRERFLSPTCLDYRWNTNNYVVHGSPLLHHSLNQVSPWFPMRIHSYNLMLHWIRIASFSGSQCMNEMEYYNTYGLQPFCRTLLCSHFIISTRCLETRDY